MLFQTCSKVLEANITAGIFYIRAVHEYVYANKIA